MGARLTIVFIAPLLLACREDSLAEGAPHLPKPGSSSTRAGSAHRDLSSSPVSRSRVFINNDTVPVPARSGFKYPRFDARLRDGDEVQLQSVHGTWLYPSVEPSAILANRVVALQDTASGNYCDPTFLGSGGGISCRRQHRDWSTAIRVLPAKEPGKVHLQASPDSSKARYCSDSPVGIRCTSSHPGDWETFSLIDAGGGTIGLRGSRLNKFCTDRGTGLICDRASMGSYVSGTPATFKPISDSPLAAAMITQTKDARLAGVFVVHRPDPKSHLLALRCKGLGPYLSVDQSGSIACSSPSPWMIGSARVSWWDTHTATFQNLMTNRYLMAAKPPKEQHDLGHRGAVTMQGPEASGWALWKVMLIGGYETISPLIRGVNLGDWFLLEAWMDGTLFYDSDTDRPFKQKCTAHDEYGLMTFLGPVEGTRRMEKHWATWITEEDIKWLADHGINSVRVPLGYWMVFPTAPFVPGAFKYLARMFEWCERYNIAVLLDFHGLKGSQTGNPTSGNCGACGNKECGETWIRFLDEQKVNLAVIENLTSHFAKSPMFLGFAVANEVSPSSQVNGTELMHFYQRAYNIIRKHSEHALVVLYFTHSPDKYPFNNFYDVVKDVHIYYAWGMGPPTMDQAENMRRGRSGLWKSTWPAIVGEWSLAANGHKTVLWDPEQRNRYFSSFARMQLQTWEMHSMGWFYWSYKVRFPNSTWSFRDMCKVGWIPGCSPDLEYATSKWWLAPACDFAYLEGRCSGVKEIPQEMSSVQSATPTPPIPLIVSVCSVSVIVFAAFCVTRFLRKEIPFRNWPREGWRHLGPQKPVLTQRWVPPGVDPIEIARLHPHSQKTPAPAPPFIW